jgi:hypothetical protein
MMKYIEDEMKKRRGEDITSDDKEEQSRGSNIDADILEGLGIKVNQTGSPGHLTNFI